jgi:hypothetical protein
MRLMDCRVKPGNDRPYTLTNVTKNADGRDEPGHHEQFGGREFLTLHIGSIVSSFSQSE